MFKTQGQALWKLSDERGTYNRKAHDLRVYGWHFDHRPASTFTNGHREEVISKIEMVFQNFAEAFSEEKELAVILSSRRSSSGPTAEQDTKQPDSSSSVGHSREIRFPGSTRREGWTFRK